MVSERAGGIFDRADSSSVVSAPSRAAGASVFRSRTAVNLEIRNFRPGIDFSQVSGWPPPRKVER